MNGFSASDIASMAGATLRIDLDALVDNYRLIARQVAPAQVAGVVKANAYGLGAVEVSEALMTAGCTHFFVAHLMEAAELKPHLTSTCRLYILNGLQPGAEGLCARIGAIPVLNSLDQLTRWSGFARQAGRFLPAVLQVDSGMARLGLSPEEVEILLAEPERLDHVDLVLLMSHLACADDPDATANAEQAARFARIAAHFPDVPCSLDNSGGAFLNRADHHDIVRAGIALYGGAPQFGQPNPTRPVVSLEASIVQLRDIPAGAGVGYGLSFTAFAASRIATISLGYADGWLRQLGQRSSAFIAGIRVPIAGRVSMDSITLDVTHVPDQHLHAGAPVELLGPHQGIDDVAADAGTISYEILTRLGQRFQREYLPVRASAVQRRRCA
jgi:alanine racemase